MQKTIIVEGKTWEKLMNTKIANHDRTIDDVIQRLFKRSGS
jgi:predicted CopG family antitoxin